jgi:hypothetical protein
MGSFSWAQQRVPLPIQRVNLSRKGSATRKKRMLQVLSLPELRATTQQVCYEAISKLLFLVIINSQPEKAQYDAFDLS